jgi:hypothetical protein
MEAHHVCPDCGSIDLELEQQSLHGPTGAPLGRATCPNCAWTGALRDTHGFATTEALWTVERVADLLLRVCAVHAAGPIVQSLEFVGLIPKKLEVAPEMQQPNWSAEDLREHNKTAQTIRDRVMRRTFEAMISAAFEEASECHQAYGRGPSPVTTTGAGAEVVNIEQARKKH